MLRECLHQKSESATGNIKSAKTNLYWHSVSSLKYRVGWFGKKSFRPLRISLQPKVLLIKSHPIWRATWAVLTDCMPLVYPWAVNSWSTGSHIINTNKTLSSCSPFTSAQPQAVREAFGGVWGGGQTGSDQGLVSRSLEPAEAWGLISSATCPDSLRGRPLPGWSRGKVSWWRLGRRRRGDPPLFPGHSPHRNLGTETYNFTLNSTHPYKTSPLKLFLHYLQVKKSNLDFSTDHVLSSCIVRIFKCT